LKQRRIDRSKEKANQVNTILAKINWKEGEPEDRARGGGRKDFRTDVRRKKGNAWWIQKYFLNERRCVAWKRVSGNNLTDPHQKKSFRQKENQAHREPQYSSVGTRSTLEKKRLSRNSHKKRPRSEKGKEEF